MNPQQTPYTDLQTVKAFLNIQDSDTSQDTFLTIIIPMTQTFIERYTGRTFGWGDTDSQGQALDDPHVDYSNTDDIGVSSITANGNLLTINTMGPVPWQVGANIQLFATNTPAWNGVWAVTAKPSATQFVISIATSTGTLSATNSQAIPTTATNFNGYCGNYVQNYQYITQESYDGIVGKEIWLRYMDIRSVDSVYIGLRNIAQPVLLDHTQYVWRDDGRVILGGSYFNSYDSDEYSGDGGDNSFYGSIAAGFQTITVSYYCGYVGVPPEISLAAADLTMAYYVLRKGLGLQEERVGDWQTRYDISFRKALMTQPDSLNTLNMFKKRHI